MLRQAESLDLHLFRLVNSEWTSPWADVFFGHVADSKFWALPMGLGVMALLVWGGFKGRALVAMAAMALLVGDAGIIQGIRAVVDRGRPWQTVEDARFVDMNGVEIRQPRGFEQGRSFPSGHVCNNAAISWLAVMLYGARFHALWLWVALVAYARVYTSAHFPSDVFFSVPIALAYAHAIFLMAGFVWTKWGGVWFPVTFKKNPKL